MTNDDIQDALRDISKYFRIEEYKNADSPCQTKQMRHQYYSRMVEKCETIPAAVWLPYKGTL